MADRTVVYRGDTDSESTASVSRRLQAQGIEIIEEQPDMLLVSGAPNVIHDIVDVTKGWNASAETVTPRPDTEFSATRPPDDE